MTTENSDTPVETASIPVTELAELRIAAMSWWSFWGSDAYHELIDREVVHRLRQASIAVSRGARWSIAVGPSHRELEQLRTTPAWVSACTASGCLWQETVLDRTQWTNRCPQHAAGRQAVPT